MVRFGCIGLGARPAARSLQRHRYLTYREFNWPTTLIYQAGF